MNEKIKKFWKDKPIEQIKSSFNFALNILMIAEFIFSVIGYLLIKHFVSLSWAELWMLVIYGITLKSCIDLYEPVLKKEIFDEIEQSKKEDTIDNGAKKDIEDNSSEAESNSKD